MPGPEVAEVVPGKPRKMRRMQPCRRMVFLPNRHLVAGCLILQSPRGRRKLQGLAGRAREPRLAVLSRRLRLRLSLDQYVGLDLRSLIHLDRSVPGDDTDTVGKVDAGDGGKVVADEWWDNLAAVAPEAEMREAFRVANGLIERLAREGRLDGDIGDPPEAGTIERVHLAQTQLKDAKD